MSKIEKVLIIMIAIIVTAFSLMYTDERNQHEKDVNTVIMQYESLELQYDSLEMITSEAIKLTYAYDSISNDAIDSAVKYKKLYLKNK